jgi:hypothetical protein
MDFVKKIPPAWIAVALLIVVVIVLLFSQRRSGYTPTAGAPITLMDLQEFSGFTAEQKSMYTKTLMDSSNDLSQAVASKSMDALQAVITNIMRQALGSSPILAAPTAPTAPGVTQCLAGTYSSTGSQPCTPCPANTYCPAVGMKTPLTCPPNYMSNPGSMTCMPKPTM